MHLWIKKKNWEKGEVGVFLWLQYLLFLSKAIFIESVYGCFFLLFFLRGRSQFLLISDAIAEIRDVKTNPVDLHVQKMTGTESVWTTTETSLQT